MRGGWPIETKAMLERLRTQGRSDGASPGSNEPHRPGAREGISQARHLMRCLPQCHPGHAPRNPAGLRIECFFQRVMRRKICEAGQAARRGRSGSRSSVNGGRCKMRRGRVNCSRASWRARFGVTRPTADQGRTATVGRSKTFAVGFHGSQTGRSGHHSCAYLLRRQPEARFRIRWSYRPQW